MTTTFEDHFSALAQTYAQHRPHYPAGLFAYLARHAPTRALAWDCATGSGQAARSLVDYFGQVVASDASAGQIGQAPAHPRIAYRLEQAEQTSLPSASVDLLTVAVAIHWFDLERFYPEARRVLKPGGVIAVWTYHRPQVTPAVEALVAHLEEHILGPYWPEQIHYIRAHYQTLPFPFAALQPPGFAIQTEWRLEQMLGFVNSWSAVRRFENQHGFNPLQSIWEDFLAAWGGPERTHPIRWPLYTRIGQVAPA